MKSNKLYYGFTLAEVLITLVIIGIIAAITVPTVMTSNEKKSTKAKVKKNYAVIGGAFEKFYLENGYRFTAKDASGVTDSLKPIILKYFLVSKDCGKYSCPYLIYKNYKGQAISYNSYFDDGQFVLQDGTYIMIENYSAEGNLFLSADINGFDRGPNRLGKDLFMFQIDEKGLVRPMGAEGTYFPNGNNDKYCSDNSTENMNGAGCTYKILQDKE